MSEKPTEPGSEGLPKRWSARRKSEIVLRLLRGRWSYPGGLNRCTQRPWRRLHMASAIRGFVEGGR